jgi:thymidylate kinase
MMPNADPAAVDKRPDTVVAWAAYLLASWWAPNGAMPAPGVGADPKAVVRVLRRNGVPLLTLADDPRPAAAALLRTPPFAAALAEDQASMARQRAAFTEIAAAWRAAGIPALFVKALGPLPTFPYISSNLDVGVPQAQQDMARQIVRALGYVELRHLEEPNKFLLRRYHLGASAFDIHIHGRLEWHTEFLDTPVVWLRSQIAPDCDLAAIPAPEDGILIALAHALYENKTLKLIELGKVIYAARRLAVDWDRAADGAQRKGWLPGFWLALALCARWEAQLYDAVSLPESVCAQAEAGLAAWQRNYLDALPSLTGPAQAPVRLSFTRSKRLFYAKMLTDPTLKSRARLREVVVHTVFGTRLRLHMRSQRPLLVALDGIDGCGKSTQAALLASALEGSTVRHSVVWTRGGSSTLLQPIIRLGKRLMGQGAGNGSQESGGREQEPGGLVSEPQFLLPVEDVRERERAALFRHPLARAVWPWLIVLELGLVYQRRVRWPLWRGDVVVADRYVLSALTDLGARLGQAAVNRTAAGRLLLWLAPRPQHTFWFDVPPELALARKAGAESAAMLLRQTAVIRSLAAELGVTQLDATAPLAEISDGLVTEVLRGYFDAHRTVLNTFFFANPRPLPAEWQEHSDE